LRRVKSESAAELGSRPAAGGATVKLICANTAGQSISKTATLLAVRRSDWLGELADIITPYKYGTINYFEKLSIVPGIIRNPGIRQRFIYLFKTNQAPVKSSFDVLFRNIMPALGNSQFHAFKREMGSDPPSSFI